MGERSSGSSGSSHARGEARTQLAAALATTWAAMLLFALPLAAQVGHRPESSPYHDIRGGHAVTPYLGQFGGSGGRFQIGPHDGPVYGLRYDLRTGSTIQVRTLVA